MPANPPETGGGVELLPCAHCGAPSYFVRNADRVKCTRPSCGVEGGRFERHQNAIASWQTRTPALPSEREVEAVARAIAQTEACHADDWQHFVEQGRAAITALRASEAAAERRGMERREVYVASRASLPERGEMWRAFRAEGVPINSTWIDEDGPKASRDLGDLWDRIRREVTSAERLVLYVEPGDFPLKGALIEVGMALAAQVPVYVVAPGVELDPRNCRPLGSWVKSPLVRFAPDVRTAMEDRP